MRDLETPTRRTERTVIAYGALVGAPLLGLVFILSRGGSLSPPLNSAAAASAPRIPAAMAVLNLPLLLVQITVIIAVARGVALALRRIGQPPVVGEMLAGLLLGRSFLGIVAPAVYDWLFPPGTVRFLNALSQIGLVLFMFLIGLDIDLDNVLARARQVVVVAHASIAVPLFSGAALATFLYTRYATIGTPFPAFGLFIGCAMSVTAFPVLARILNARGLTNTAFGSLAIAAAAFADVTAWIILAFVVAVARRGGGAFATLSATVGWATVYLVIMFVAARPALRSLWRVIGRRRAVTADAVQDEMTIALILVLLSAVVTEYLGVHALFGAFVAGAVMPRERPLRAALTTRLADVLNVLLLPLFFAYAGLRTNVAALASADLIAGATILAVAIASKLGASAVAARCMGVDWRHAGALGVLMNARGLIELVLLTIGLQSGIIVAPLYTLMVLMAVTTTLMASPLVAFLMRRAPGELDESKSPTHPALDGAVSQRASHDAQISSH